jgi:hypothetical protein
MMKNIWILGFSTLLLLSCSNDDDGTETETTIKKYPDSYVFTKDGESDNIKIIYNDQMQITGYADQYSTISFVYENGRVAKVKEGTGVDPYTLRYTNGILSGLDHYTQSYPVIFNAQQNSYQIGDYTSFGLVGRDVSFVSNTVDNSEKFTYDISKKGALNSLPDDSIFPVTIFANFRYYFLSSSAITSITVSDNGTSVVYAAQNTYDSDGFLKSTVMKSGTDELFRVDYKYFEK